MREIVAKYSGRCDECGERIEAGERCLFDYGEKFLLHIECGADREQNEKCPIKPAQSGVVARFNPPKK